MRQNFVLYMFLTGFDPYPTPNGGRIPTPAETPPVKSIASIRTRISDSILYERHDDAGAVELEATFADPAYRPEQHAFYYVRVMENPSCRWTTWFANGAGVPPPDDVPLTVQNRGWSSPIWREPQQNTRVAATDMGDFE